jgi:hypothetical protein
MTKSSETPVESAPNDGAERLTPNDGGLMTKAQEHLRRRA